MISLAISSMCIYLIARINYRHFVVSHVERGVYNLSFILAHQIVMIACVTTASLSTAMESKGRPAVWIIVGILSHFVLRHSEQARRLNVLLKKALARRNRRYNHLHPL